MLGRRREPPIDHTLVYDVIGLIMRMDAKLDQILRALGVDDGEDRPEH